MGDELKVFVKVRQEEVKAEKLRLESIETQRMAMELQ